jgi:hypothetical protein
MFEPILASEALAAAGDLPAHNGQYPILELFGGIISLIVVGLAALGYRNATPPPAAPPASPEQPMPPGGASDGVHLYFGGPLQKIFDHIREIEERLDTLVTLHGETRNQMALHAGGLDTERQIEVLTKTLDALTTLVVRLDEFARLSLKK